MWAVLCGPPGGAQAGCSCGPGLVVGGVEAAAPSFTETVDGTDSLTIHKAPFRPDLQPDVRNTIHTQRNFPLVFWVVFNPLLAKYIYIFLFGHEIKSRYYSYTADGGELKCVGTGRGVFLHLYSQQLRTRKLHYRWRSFYFHLSFSQTSSFHLTVLKQQPTRRQDYSLPANGQRESK